MCHVSAVIMELRQTHWRQNQRCENPTGVSESYYDVVDDLEFVHNVHIQPARPIVDEREYADRDLPRSLSAHSLSSCLDTGNTHPTYPPKKTTPKPGDRLKPTHHKETPSQRCPLSPQLPLELADHLNGLTLQENCRREAQKSVKRVPQFTHEGSSEQSVLSPRFPMDLDPQHLVKRWPNDCVEVTKSPHCHHECPQTENEFDQHDFAPTDTLQPNWENDWYVGACSRTDAEHALHLVNKDGAFLVRDCSLNSNSEPLVLSVYHEKKVYNVKIRFIENQRKYALGTGQRSNEMFNTVADIIRFHSIFPIVLISGKNIPGSKWPENCVLTCPMTRRDIDQLLQ